MVNVGSLQASFQIVGMDAAFTSLQQRFAQAEARPVRLSLQPPDTSALAQAERALTAAQAAASNERIAAGKNEAAQRIAEANRASREMTAAANLTSREQIAVSRNTATQTVAAERTAAQQATAAMRAGAQERIAEANREGRERIAAANNAAKAERDAARQNTSSSRGGGVGFGGAVVAGAVANVATNAAATVWENGTKAIIGYNDQLDRGRVALEGLLGSQEKAATYQKELLTLANATPFSYEQVEKGAIRFLNLGLSAAQSKALVIDAGNAVAKFGGTSEQVDRVTLAIAQVGAKGKVSAEELNQLGESGVPGLKILSEYLHISTGETLKWAAASKISAQDFFGAMHEYGQLPDVAGAMEKQSHTFGGAMSTITDALKLAGATAFRPLFDGIVDAANKIAAFVSTPWFASFVDHIAAAVKSGMALLGQFLAFLAPVGKAILAAFGIDTADLSKQIDDAMKAAKVPTSDPHLFGDTRAATQGAADAAKVYADNIKTADANILTFRQHLDEVNVALQANKDKQQAVHDLYDPQIRTNARAIQDAQRLTPSESARNTRLAEIGIAKMRIEVERPDTSVYEGVVKEADRYLRQLSEKKYTVDLGFANEGKALEAEAHRLSKLNTDAEEGRVKDVQTRIRSLSDAVEGANRAMEMEARPIRERMDEAARAVSERTRLLDVGAKKVRDEMEVAQKLTDSQTRALDIQGKTIRTRMDEAARATAEQTRLLDVQSKTITAQAAAAQKASEGVVRGLDVEAKTVQNSINDLSEGARVETTAIERWVTGQRDALRGIGDEADAQIAVLSKQADALKTQMDAIGRDRSVDRRIEDLQRQLSGPTLDTSGYRNQLAVLAAQGQGGADVGAQYAAVSGQMTAATRADAMKRAAAKTELGQLQERVIIQKRMDEDHRADLQGQLTIIEGQTKAIRESADTRKAEIEAGIRAAEIEKQSIADTLTLQKDLLQGQLDGIERRKGAVQDEARLTAETFAGRLAGIAAEKDTLTETARIAHELDEGRLRAIDSEKDRITENARIAREGFDARLTAIETEKAGVIEAARIVRESDEGRLRDIDRRRTLLADIAYDQGKELDAELKGAQAALDARTKDIATQRAANAEASYQLGLRKTASDEYFAAEEHTANSNKQWAQDRIKAVDDEVKRQTVLLDKEAAGLSLAKAEDDLRRAATLAPLQTEQDRLNRAMEDALLPLQKRQAELEKEARYWQNLITEAERYKQTIEQAKKAVDAGTQKPGDGFIGPPIPDWMNTEMNGPPAPGPKVENGWTQFFDNVGKAADKAKPFLEAFWNGVQGKDVDLKKYDDVQTAAYNVGLKINAGWTAVKDFWKGLTTDAPPDPGAKITAAETAGRNLHTFWVKDLLPTMRDIWSYLDTNVLPKLGDLATYISGTLLPAWTSWQLFMAGLALQALQGIATFIFKDLLPQLRDLWGYLDKNINPVFTEIGRILNTIGTPALVSFAGAVAPLNAVFLGLDLIMLAPFKSFGAAIEGIMLAAINSFLAPLQTGLNGIGLFVNSVKAVLNDIGGLFNNPTLGGTPWPVPNILVAQRTAAPGGGGGADKLAVGTDNWKGGPALIGEAGRELYSVGGKVYLADSPLLLTLPAGSVVYNNAETERILSNTAVSGGGRGAGPVDGISEAWNATQSAVGGFFSNLGSSAQSIKQQATTALTGALGGLQMPELPGVLKGIGPAIADKIKSTVTEGIKGLLAPFGGTTNTPGATGTASGPLATIIDSLTSDPHVRQSMKMAALMETGGGLTGPWPDQIGGGPGRGPFQIEAQTRYHMDISEAAARDPALAAAYMLPDFARNVPKVAGELWERDPKRASALGAYYSERPDEMYPDDRIDRAWAALMGAAGAGTTANVSGGYPSVLAQAVAALGDTGWGSGFDTLCEGFAEQMERNAGFDEGRWPSAAAHGYGVSHDKGWPAPPGAMAHWGTGYFPTYGHAGISTGDGSIIGTTMAGTIQKYDMAGKPDYLGWLPPGLADGGITVGGNPFPVIVGDGPQGEREIHAPEPVMRDVVRDALRERDGGEKPTFVFERGAISVDRDGNVTVDPEKVAVRAAEIVGRNAKRDKAKRGGN